MSEASRVESNSVRCKRLDEKERDCLVLIFSYLQRKGYIDSATTLQSEGGAVLSRYEAADNIDLLSILCEFEEQHENRSGRKPKFTRPLPSFSRQDVRPGITIDKRKTKKARHVALMRIPESHEGSEYMREIFKSNRRTCSERVSSSLAFKKPVNDQILPSNSHFSINGTSNFEKKTKNMVDMKETPDEVKHCVRVLRPLPDFGGNVDLKELAAGIQRDIVQDPPSQIEWDKIIGLDEAKQTLKEALVIPFRYPKLFEGIMCPWNGILLYGPPGTGKTLLAKAVASQCETTFFNITSSSIVSKYRGDSEKIIRVLFDLARYHAPSTIFIDEIDSIMGHRGGSAFPENNSVNGISEHEGSRRMKTEMLIQMDGLLSRRNGASPNIFLIAASNLPWDLDVALLRRLEKRIFVPLPGYEDRVKMISKKLKESNVKQEIEHGVIESCAAQTKGFSGADLDTYVKEVLMKPVRRILSEIEKVENKRKLHTSATSADNCGKLDESELTLLIRSYFSIKSDDLLSCLNLCKSTAGGTNKYFTWTKNIV